jgi:hypothetical protein
VLGRRPGAEQAEDVVAGPLSVRSHPGKPR